MEKNIAVDESLTKFKKRVSYKQFNPSKSEIRNKIL